MTATETEENQLEEEIGEDRVRLWPDLSYWFGMGALELAALPKAIRGVYERAIPRIRAQHLRLAMDASAYPHMKKEDAERFNQQVSTEIRVGLPTPEMEGAKTPQEMVGGLTAHGIGMVEVDAEGHEKEEAESTLAEEAKAAAHA